jgi:hypothetical protein
MTLIGCDKQVVSNNGKVLTNNQWHTVGERIVNELELPALMMLSEEEIRNELGINTDHLESFLVLMPMMRVHATEILVFQVKEDMMETVKTKVDDYLHHYEEYWSSYLPEQHVLVRNRLEKTLGNTLIVIVAENRNLIETIIDQALFES